MGNFYAECELFKWNATLSRTNFRHDKGRSFEAQAVASFSCCLIFLGCCFHISHVYRPIEYEPTLMCFMLSHFRRKVEYKVLLVLLHHSLCFYRIMHGWSAHELQSLSSDKCTWETWWWKHVKRLEWNALKWFSYRFPNALASALFRHKNPVYLFCRTAWEVLSQWLK